MHHMQSDMALNTYHLERCARTRGEGREMERGEKGGRKGREMGRERRRGGVRRREGEMGGERSRELRKQCS